MGGKTWRYGGAAWALFSALAACSSDDATGGAVDLADAAAVGVGEGGLVDDPLQDASVGGDGASNAPVDAAAPTGFVGRHGALHVQGTHIVDAQGEVVQLRGMSLFWSQWGDAFWNAQVVHTLAHDWNATVVRAAMGVESRGYLENPAREEARVDAVVQAAVAEGIYVIVDWHDHHAHQHLPQAQTFFASMAAKYGNTPNVVFEVYNEPLADVSWGEVKSYAESVLGTLRGAGAGNLVLVGSPHWSQDVDVAADAPVSGFADVAYTLHFYAGSHRAELRAKASTAMAKGLALFASEWGSCDASGNGGLDLEESARWLGFLDEHRIGWANWSLFDKDETASALKPGASTTGPWTEEALTPSGSFVKSKILAP